MIKTKNKKIYTIIISLIILFSAFTALAEGTCDQKTGKDASGNSCYVLLEPSAFPGIADQTGSSLGLGNFLGQVFNFGIAIAVVLALAMIIWGGIMYMTSDSWTGKDDGKSKIQDALIGLGIALVSWLLLYTINPNLVTFQNNTFLGTTQTTTK